MVKRSSLVRVGLSAVALLGAAAGALVALGGRFADERSLSAAGGPSAAATGEVPCESGSACAMQGHPGPGAKGGAAPLAGQPRLVEFLSGSCPACERMAPIVADLERRCLAAEKGLLVRINVDEPEGEALADHYGVNALPTFMGVDAHGSEVLRMVGVQTPQKLASTIGEVRGRACPAL